MPETRFGEMAGNGILKTGTTFSINPVQNLRFVTVTDRLTVPADTNPDSAASVAYVHRILSGSGKVMAGNGLTANNGIVALDKKQTFSQVTLTKNPEASTDAATVAYVDESILDKASKTYVDLAIDEIREGYAPKQYIEDALVDLVSRPNVTHLISESEAVTKAYITDLATNFATTDDVDSLISTTREFVKQTELDQSIGHVKEVLDTLQDKVEDKASLAYVESVEVSKVSKEDFAQYFRNVPTKAYVDGKVDVLVSRVVFDENIDMLAPRDYVDASVAGLATTEYVDTSLASYEASVKSDVQYVVPTSGDVVNVNSCAFVILNPKTTLDSLTLAFPSTTNLQQQNLVISTSCDILNLTFTGLITPGDVVVPSSMILTAGQPLRFIFVVQAQAWFIA